MPTSKTPVSLAGATPHRSRHACAFCNSRGEAYDALMRFVEDGFKLGEKMCHIVDPDHRPERMRRLAEAGIRDRDLVDVRPWEGAHLGGGRFDMEGMLALVQREMESTTGSGRTRWWGNMEWALTGAPGVEDLIEYESRLNEFLPNYDDVVVCTYDLSKFAASVVMVVMRTHPMVIIGGILQENPFFVPPDEFLRKLRGRASHAA